MHHDDGMTVFLNGQFVPEDQAVVPVFDRGFLYGDGVFETMRVYHGMPFRWAQHWDRLRRGAELLRLRLPFAAAELRHQANELVRLNRLGDCILRLAVSRGTGPRGYSFKGGGPATVVMSTHPLPAGRAEPGGWRLATSSLRVLAGDPLAAVKSSNKLLHILARAEAEEQGADEALLLNERGEIAEAASANVFWMAGGVLRTPPVQCGALAGVTRALVFELCTGLGAPCREEASRPEALLTAEGVFLTSSAVEIGQVSSLDGYAIPSWPKLAELRRAYARAVEQEICSDNRA